MTTGICTAGQFPLVYLPKYHRSYFKYRHITYLYNIQCLCTCALHTLRKLFVTKLHMYMRTGYILYSAYISRIWNRSRKNLFNKNLSHCAVTPMGNTNSRNLFNEFLQSSYSRKFRPAKNKRYTVYTTLALILTIGDNKYNTLK